MSTREGKITHQVGFHQVCDRGVLFIDTLKRKVISSQSEKAIRDRTLVGLDKNCSINTVFASLNFIYPLEIIMICSLWK